MSKHDGITYEQFRKYFSSVNYAHGMDMSKPQFPHSELQCYHTMPVDVPVLRKTITFNQKQYKLLHL